MTSYNETSSISGLLNLYKDFYNWKVVSAFIHPVDGRSYNVYMNVWQRVGEKKFESDNLQNDIKMNIGFSFIH